MLDLDSNYRYYFNVDTRDVTTEDNIFYIFGDKGIQKIYITLLEQDKNKLDKYISHGDVIDYNCKLILIPNHWIEKKSEIIGVLQENDIATYLFELDDELLNYVFFNCELEFSGNNKKIKSKVFKFNVEKDLRTKEFFYNKR